MLAIINGNYIILSLKRHIHISISYHFSETVRKSGFTVLVDMRQGTWPMIKKVLEGLKVKLFKKL